MGVPLQLYATMWLLHIQAEYVCHKDTTRKEGEIILVIIDIKVLLIKMKCSVLGVI